MIRSPQASKVDEETTITINVINVPDMKPSNGRDRRFRPMAVTIAYAGERTDVQVRGPWIVSGIPGPAWTSRYFLGDLGIDAGPRWLRKFVEDFRPDNRNRFTTSTMLSEEPIA